MTKKFKESFEVEEYRVLRHPKPSPKKSPQQNDAKRLKLEIEEETIQDEANDEGDEILYEEFTYETDNDRDLQTENDDAPLIYLAEDPLEKDTKTSSKTCHPATSVQVTKEEKFIDAVYPQFKGKTKLNLIEEILELKRKNDTLQIKAKTYENTINRLLN